MLKTRVPLGHGVLRLLELVQPGGWCPIVVLQLQALLRLAHRVLQQALCIAAPLFKEEKSLIKTDFTPFIAQLTRSS